MTRFLGVIFVCLAGFAQAQDFAQDVDRETALGPITIVEGLDGFSHELHVGDARFFTDAEYPFLSIEAQRGALYLVELGSGGSACAAKYVWLHTDEANARLGPVFGTCGALERVRSDGETVTVTVQAIDAADGFVDFTYDGRDMTEQVAGQQSSGIGTDAGNWVGRYPFEIFADADWRDPLVALMGDAAYRRAGETIETATKMQRQGDWVVGQGCRNSLCGVAYGAIALHDDGRVLVAVRTEAAGLEVFGELDGTPPDLVAEVIAGR